MYGGDEVGSLVFDIGSFNSRFGYSGEDTPRFVFQSQVGITNNMRETLGEDVIMSNTNGQKIFFGEDELRFYKDGIKVESPVNSQGYVENIDLLDKLMNNVYSKCFRAESKDHPILFSEPALHNKENRIAISQLFFEKYEIPAIFVAKMPVLSAFSCGRSTCLVFDSGHNHTTATPINDGYALQKSLIKFSIGGSLVTNELESILKQRNINITPHYKILKERVSPDSDSFTVKYLNSRSAEKSYDDFWTKEIIREMKENCLAVNEDANSYGKEGYIKSSSYELPDGINVDFKTEKFSITEKMFFGKNEIPGFNGYTQMIIDSINKSDIDIKKEMFSNIFVCGGNSLFQNFPERLQRLLISTAPQNVRIKVLTHPSLSERKFSSWIGGSILSSLGTFHQMWFSKQEYEEHGAALIERKCA